MQVLRSIAALFVLLLVISVQCRAQCIVIPHEAAESAPECPLHKKQAPEQAKCSHAPQWDLEDSRQVAILPSLAPSPLMVASIEVSSRAPFVQPFTAAKPPLILRI